MTAHAYPFVTHDVFFTSLQAARKRDVPNEYTVTIEIGVQVGLRTDNLVEVTLELSTGTTDQVVTFKAIVKGVFRPQDGFSIPPLDEFKRLLDEFVTERAVSILWGYADLTIRHLLISLGVNVVKILPELNVTNTLGASTPLQPPAEPR